MGLSVREESRPGIKLKPNEYLYIRELVSEVTFYSTFCTLQYSSPDES
jgi:hypothetical protein